MVKKTTIHDKNYKKFVNHISKDLRKKKKDLKKKHADKIADELWVQINHASNKTYGSGIDRQKETDEYIKTRTENEKIKQYIHWAELARNGYTVYKIGNKLITAFL